jgi:hypothetical protein
MCLLSFAMGIWLLVTFWLKTNPHLLLKLATNFDVLYMTANIVLSVAGLVDVFRGDERMAFFATMWVSTMTLIYFDAGHVTGKRHQALATIVGIIVFVIIIAGLQFGLFPDMKVRTIGLTISNVGVFVNNVAFVNERLATVLLFFCKNLYTVVRHPGCYANLKARLTHEKIPLRGTPTKATRERQLAEGHFVVESPSQITTISIAIKCHAWCWLASCPHVPRGPSKGGKHGQKT